MLYLSISQWQVLKLYTRSFWIVCVELISNQLLCALFVVPNENWLLTCSYSFPWLEFFRFEEIDKLLKLPHILYLINILKKCYLIYCPFQLKHFCSFYFLHIFASAFFFLFLLCLLVYSYLWVEQISALLPEK